MFNRNFRDPYAEPRDIWEIGGMVLHGIKIFFNVLFILGVLAVAFGGGTALGYAASMFEKVQVPEPATLVDQVGVVSGISTLHYADGTLISEVKSDLLRQPVGLDAISPYVRQAVIATEDENFEMHPGIVPKAIARAALGTMGIGNSSGGSTLTQQLVKQQVVGDAFTYSRKVSEIVYALELERHLSKDEILNLYLNVSPFGRNRHGQNIAGVEEAAQGIFGVPAANLSVPQAAFIAGLPQNPIIYSPYNQDGNRKTPEETAAGIARSKDVLYNMYRNGYLTKADYDSYVAYDITQDFLPGEPITIDTGDYLYYAVMDEAKEVMYQHLIQRDAVSAGDLTKPEIVDAYKKLAEHELSQGGYAVTTTINKPVYDAMQQVAANQSGILQDGTTLVESGNVLLDNDTGAVIAFVGGLNYANNQVNHAFGTNRSPGSNIKPIMIYGPAIDHGIMGSASILSNYPTTYSGGQRIMHGYSAGTGMEPLQNALNHSQNIPAFWTYKALQQAGVDVKGYMEKMNIHIAEYGIESLPLGSGIEVTVAQMANAYQTLANDGVYQKHYMIERITSKTGELVYEHQANPVQVYSKPGATIMQELLRGPIKSGATTTFLSSLSAYNGTLAGADWIGKTGSTDHYADVWLSVSTPAVTMSGWAGHDNNKGMPEDSGYVRNSQYVARMLAAAYAADPSVFGDLSERFQLDGGVIASNVLAATGQLPGSVTIDGISVNVGGATTTSLWATRGAPQTNYKFMIGGTDNDYAMAWSSLVGDVKKEQEEREREEREKEEREKEEQEKKEKEEEEDEDSSSSSSSGTSSSSSTSTSSSSEEDEFDTGSTQ